MGAPRLQTLAVLIFVSTSGLCTKYYLNLSLYSSDLLWFLEFVHFEPLLHDDARQLNTHESSKCVWYIIADYYSRLKSRDLRVAINYRLDGTQYTAAAPLSLVHLKASDTMTFTPDVVFNLACDPGAEARLAFDKLELQAGTFQTYFTIRCQTSRPSGPSQTDAVYLI